MPQYQEVSEKEMKHCKYQGIWMKLYDYGTESA
jgi:hypothetical protein